MKKQLLQTVLSIFFILGAMQLFSQEVVSTAGNHDVGNSTQVSWTIGEPVIETEMNGQYIVTQGMHQGNLEITVAREIKDLAFDVSAYPNPVSRFLKLEIGAPQLEGFSYALFSASGQLLRQEKINEKVTTIPMEQFTHSSYLLRVMSEGNEIKVFQVVKNQQ